MQNKYSKKQIEELYNCEIFKDSDLGLWVAQAVQFTDDEEDCFFVQASGHDVDELHENIRKKIRNHAYLKGYNTAIDEFAEQMKRKSSDILIWLMERQEAGYGTSNGELHDKWLSKVDEIAEQMKAK